MATRDDARVIIGLGCLHQRIMALDCNVFRITGTGDFQRSDGRKHVGRRSMRHQGIPVLVWVSFPCTGGLAWQAHKLHNGTGATTPRTRNHWTALHEVWQRFADVFIPRPDSENVDVAWGWPYTLVLTLGRGKDML